MANNYYGLLTQQQLNQAALLQQGMQSANTAGVSMAGFSQLGRQPVAAARDIDIVHTTKPLRAYRGFYIGVDPAGQPVLRALVQKHYIFDGPVARTAAPTCQARLAAIMADPLAALERLGEQELLKQVRQREYSHGFYAYKQEGCIMPPGTNSQYYNASIEGTVDLFGTVVEHDYGYRAECLRINKLKMLVPVEQAVHQALERRYQCEVVPCKSEKRSESMRYNSTAQTPWTDPYGWFLSSPSGTVSLPSAKPSL